MTTRLELRWSLESPWLAMGRVLGDPASVRTILVGGPNFDKEIHKLRTTYPRATLHCFEPTPRRYGALSEQYRPDRRVLLWPQALADVPGHRPFYLNGLDGTNSLYEANPSSLFYGSCRGTEAIDVETTTIDQYCYQHKLTAVDLLFMDIQGAEYLALRGAAQLLEKGAIRAVFGEVLFAEIYEGAPGFCEIDGLMKGYGYSLVGLYRLAWHGLGRLQWGDFLYERAPGI